MEFILLAYKVFNSSWVKENLRLNLILLEKSILKLDYNAKDGKLWPRSFLLVKAKELIITFIL